MERNDFFKNLTLLTFKIVCELVLILAVLFLLGLTADSILPGIISSKVNFTKFIFSILVGLSLVMYIANKYNLDFPASRPKKTAVLLAAVFLLLIFSFSLWGFARLEMIIILFLTFVVVYFFYKILISTSAP